MRYTPVILLMCFSIGFADWPCPLPSSIIPCICTSNGEYITFMDCSAVTSDQELQNALNVEFPFYDFEDFIIGQSNPDTSINILNANSFGNSYYRKILISGTNLIEIEEQALLKSEPELVQLDLSDNHLNSFPFETLQNFVSLTDLSFRKNNFSLLPPIISPTLQNLDFSENPLMTIFSGVFDSSPMLKTIDLSQTLISAFPSNLFINLDLTIIDLSFNQLTEVESNSIQSLSGDSIAILQLENNKISLLRENAITGLSNTARLYFMNNMISKLNENEWRSIFTTVEDDSIDFSNNPLVCGCDVEWLFTEPDLLHNKIAGQVFCLNSTDIHSLDPEWFNQHC